MKIFHKIIYIIWRIYKIILSPCTLEIHLADHCNLNCTSCNHYSPISDINFPEYNIIKNNIKQLKGLNLNFRILGGEPLLNREIGDFLQLLRKEFKKSKIEIITNGILLQAKFANRLPKDFFEICKKHNIIIGLTIYPINIDYSKIIEKLEQKKIRYRIFGSKEGDQGFRQFKLNLSKGHHIRNFYKCTENCCLQLIGDRIYGCAESAYSFLLEEKFNLRFEIGKKDFLQINKIKNNFKLRLFRMSPKKFCGYCHFPRKKIGWSISKKSKYEWINI